jgi:hypothetical protein
MVDVAVGNEGANKGFWREQLRDRFGMFVKMGAMVMFDIQLPGVDGVVQAFGRFIGNSELGVARLEVLDNSRIPKGVYLVKHSDITAIKAVLPDAYVEKETSEAKLARLKQSEFTPEQIKAMMWYTDNGYYDSNKFLRDGTSFTSEEDRKNLEIILDLIKNNSAKETFTAYRGRSVTNPERLAAIEALKPGDVFSDKGITSTSEDRERAEFYSDLELSGKVVGNVLYEIEIPSGTSAFKIPDMYSAYKSQEKELLLEPGTKFEVVSVEVEESGRRLIKVKIKDAAETPLKSKISGSEALSLRLRSMGNLLREDGRFPTPRMSILDRKDSDNRRAAQRDYKKVFDAEPALQEKYKTFENMWEQVYKYGTDERSKSPNVLADIPEDMKELNRAYARHFLGLEPEGLITFYRNAVNGKDTPEESAVGYASTDALMAYDYNSHRDNVAANGRYEIDAKPDEIFGMLGYSKIEDEYGVTIGRELANIPDRVRRVGDLAMVLPDAPWLKEWGLNFNRGKGASPFRQYTLATSHDFHAVEPFGESLEEFFTKYNLSAADIKKKFDQIYGEGAYDRYKATGNSVSFQRIRDLFVKLENGQIGLDVKKLENLAPLREVSEYTGDLFDNTLKMLSVFQELTGQYFMTHKTRDYAAPPAQ